VIVNQRADHWSTSGAIHPDLRHLASDVDGARQSLAKIHEALKDFVDRELRTGKGSSTTQTSLECAFTLMLDIQELSTRLAAFAHVIEAAGDQHPSAGADVADQSA